MEFVSIYHIQFNPMFSYAFVVVRPTLAGIAAAVGRAFVHIDDR